jgi:hypothetical protein
LCPLLLSPSERRKLCDDHARRQKDLFVDLLFQHPQAITLKIPG